MGRRASEGMGTYCEWRMSGEAQLRRKDMACGRVFDLMVEKSGASRSSQDDPRQVSGVCLMEEEADRAATESGRARSAA